MKLHKPPYSYAFALAMTACATALCGALQPSLPAANLVLVYIAAVILVAVSTSIFPALATGFTSFLSFNFFFTEPRSTLMMTHREDILTGALLLLTAILVGSLAARLREKVTSLELKESFARIEQVLLESLSVALNEEAVRVALETALQQLYGTPCHVLRVQDKQPLTLAAGKEALAQETLLELERQRTTAHFPRQFEIKSGQHWLLRRYPDNEGEDWVLLPCGDYHLMGAQAETIDILVHQYSLARRRVGLLADLAKERIEKERELLRSSLLSSVSHDFRTPLTAMIGATSTLLEMGNLLSAPQQRELLESVLEEAKRLDHYTQNLLDMTRLGQGNLQLERTWVSIEEIINVVMKRIRPLAQAVRLEIRLQPPLPPLQVHPALIEQALFNVLHNAVKFSPRGGLVVLAAQLEAHAGGSMLVVTIEDAGPGIPPAEREQVFRMFHAADQGDRRVAGSGLGLAICKGMIAAHGGTVTIGSAANGRGCSVRIGLPVTSAEEVARQEGT